MIQAIMAVNQQFADFFPFGVNTIPRYFHISSNRPYPAFEPFWSPKKDGRTVSRQYPRPGHIPCVYFINGFYVIFHAWRRHNVPSKKQTIRYVYYRKKVESSKYRQSAVHPRRPKIKQWTVSDQPTASAVRPISFNGAH